MNPIECELHTDESILPSPAPPTDPPEYDSSHDTGRLFSAASPWAALWQHGEASNELIRIYTEQCNQKLSAVVVG